MLDQPQDIRTLTPPARSVILRPGLRALPNGVERYVIDPGAARAIDVEPGDAIALADIEGGQVCEIVAFDGDGRVDPAIIGTSAATSAARPFAASLTLAARLKARGIDITTAAPVRVFGAASPPGDRAEFRATRAGTIVFAVPSEPMAPDGQDTATAIEIRITRANPRPSGEMPPLPEPLADPLQDIHVSRATAEAYLVRAGEYIQIIDVAGRQCSDFQCFDARKLDRGIERPLDATTTRTLLGHSYPLPGLPAKAFDHDMTPLVEIVRDTVGRHDAFALACYARFYEDMGYPGHANCTDNFTGALKRYGVTARPGWMALNFFYNTGIDAHNSLYFDEPWSRPDRKSGV